MTVHVRQPRGGDAIVHGRYGVEAIVVDVRSRGVDLTVEVHTSGRTCLEDLSRAPDGCWLRSLLPCLICGKPIHERILDYDPDGGWQPVHRKECP